MRHNFTLIELLVSIGIIAILAGLTMGVTSRAKNYAKRMNCVNNLRQIGIAINVYSAENNGFYPNACSLPSFNKANGDNVIRLCDILPIQSNSKVFLCPSDSDSPSWFLREGSSYEFNGKLSGEKIDSFSEVVQYGASKVVAVFDYDCFHAVLPAPRTKNYLFVDGHVNDIE